MKEPQPIIIIASRPEAAAILSDGIYRWQCQDGIYFSCQGLKLVITGIGKANAAFNLGRILHLGEDFISLGTSASLCSDPCATIYLCREFIEYDMDCTVLGCELGVTPFMGMSSAIIEADSLLAGRLACCLEQLKVPFLQGRSLTADRVLNHQAFVGAPLLNSLAQLADMESAVLAKLCRLHKKNFAAVRFISDQAEGCSAEHWQENALQASGFFNAILKTLL